jgi:hypothetical protein
MTKPMIPITDASGQLMQSAGKRSRQMVQDAFQMIGGVEAFAQWAQDNPTDFYTKLFSKTITTESEISHNVGIEALLDDLDAEENSGTVLDGEYEEVTDSEE